MSTDFLFRSSSIGSCGPAIQSIVVTPSNTADPPVAMRAVTINTPGTISWISWTGVTCATGPLPAGTYTMAAMGIRATGTTATDITGWV
ncbi:spike base protein, RCAP_Rcc01079 family [Paracoccus hibiscisoli]|uniref:Uncharacterized protein n=1 Tax=Paracoccus hibiscisoli TaxID=2023261 RepID=A0A4V6WID1_9RHOB|nr:hypothetical protein [Paracoccus hibiscisoli]TJZ78168.1 hypothetical protein FA740_18715 [Paracoccus hibiscisoli]